MKRLTSLAVVVVLLLPGPAAASTPATDTQATVCCPSSPTGELENFGGYVLKGTVRPSHTGDIVRFSYKRPRADRWRRFKVAGDDGVDGRGFYVLGRNRPVDRLNSRDRFRVDFTPSVAPGRWLLRVVYPQQSGLGRSADIVEVRVAGSD